MLNLEPITLYHITDSETGAYKRTVYNAHVYAKNAVKSEDGGFVGTDSIKIRIPGSAAISAAIHDYVFIGDGPETLPRAATYKIISMAASR